MSRFQKDIVQFFAVLIGVIAINVLSSNFYTRIDLTSDGRYSLKDMSLKIIKEAKGEFEMEIFLSGKLPGNYEQMKGTLKEKLEDIRAKVGKNKLVYYFTDPASLPDSSRQNLIRYGVTPVPVNSFDETEATSTLIYPGAAMRYHDPETGLTQSHPTMFLPSETWATSEEQRFLKGMNELEYAIAAPIIQLTTKKPKNITFLEGHGEPLDKIQENVSYLTQFYNVQSINLNRTDIIIKDSVDALIVLKPKKQLSEADKYKIDHYMNQGGNVLFLLDVVETRKVDSLRAFMGLVNEVNLKDLLFTYGARLNYDLIQDDECVKYIMTNGPEGYEQTIERSWRFDPILKTFANHPIVKNIEGLYTREVGTIDTLNDSGLKKTPLVYTSKNSRTKTQPIIYPFNEIELELKSSGLSMGHLPVCYLYEGRFPQHYQGSNGRPAPAGVKKLEYSKDPKSGKMLLFSDGDVILPSGKDSKGRLFPVGFERFSKRTFDNKRFLKRAIDHMLERDMIEDLRVKNLTYRPLDKNKLASEKRFWRIINLIVPPLIPVMLFLLIPLIYRKLRRQDD